MLDFGFCGGDCLAQHIGIADTLALRLSKIGETCIGRDERVLERLPQTCAHIDESTRQGVDARRIDRRALLATAETIAKALVDARGKRCADTRQHGARQMRNPDDRFGEAPVASRRVQCKRCEAGLQRGDRDDDEQGFDHDHPGRARCLVDGTSNRRSAEGHGQRLHLRAVTASAPPCVESAIGCPKALRARAINSRVRCGCSASICPLFCGQQGPLVWSAEPSSVCSVESGPDMN